jgi:hypothetical protein
MNDPMEAFLDLSRGRFQTFLPDFVQEAEDKLSPFITEKIGGLGLISFSTIHDDLPLWAYYASNFSGLCLEFDLEKLMVGDLQGEKLRPVQYFESALPPLSPLELLRENTFEALLSSLTRKRIEWAHEEEWRLITGQVGRKYYLDDALTRVFAGPRVNPEHAARLGDVFKERPVEILQGQVQGFDLKFHTIKGAQPLETSVRVGAGRFNPETDIPAEIRHFLSVPFEGLVELCRRIAARPNMHKFFHIDLANGGKEIYVITEYKLRNGRELFHKIYLDHFLRPVDKS